MSSVRVNDSWDPKTRREVLANVMNRPKTWFVKAIALKAGADKCEPNSEAGEPPWVYMMLLAMAIESLLKGSVVLFCGSQLKQSANGRLALDRQFTSHDLRRLAKRIEAHGFPLADDELHVLDRLRLFIEWIGRYPGPRCDLEMMGVGTSSDERGRTVAFYNRLLAHLKPLEHDWNEPRH